MKRNGQALASSPVPSPCGRPCARTGGMPGPRGWRGSGLRCQRGEWRREEGTAPGARVWQLPPEETRGCPRVSRRLVIRQSRADRRGAKAGKRPGNLRNLGAGREAQPGRFAEARIDPQGSLRRLQPLPLASGARLYHRAAPAGGAAVTAAPGGGLQGP